MKRVLLIILLACFSQLYCQNLGSLKGDYPLLTQRFEKELNEQRADYIFAIDVSGTMYNYKNSVVPALKEFFKALQDGDYVSVIKFGDEAVNEVGSCGRINEDMKNSLCKYADRLYTKPERGTEEYEKFYLRTDIYNMLSYLDKDMQRTTDRNNMKFVFLVTDFVHETGNPDWENLKKSIVGHQNGNLVKVFALQLPVQTKGFVPVMKEVAMVLDDFGFEPTQVGDVDGTALSQWFTQKKDDILIDKFKAIVGSKLKNAQLKIIPEVDINGKMSVDFTWQNNALFDSLKMTDITVLAKGFVIKGFTPVITGDRENVVTNLVLKYKNTSWIPAFHRVKGEIMATAVYEAGYMNEVKKLLGIEVSSAEASAYINRIVFCHPWRLGWCIVVLALFVIYIIMIFVSANRARAYRIKGTFYVTNNGIEEGERKNIVNRSRIDIGRNGTTINIADCNWDVEIYEKTYLSIVPILHLLRPTYKVRLKRGLSMSVANHKYRACVEVSLARRGNVVVDKIYTIHWI